MKKEIARILKRKVHQELSDGHCGTAREISGSSLSMIQAVRE